MTRQQQIAAGKLWTVYAVNETETAEFEGASKAACLSYIRRRYGLAAYRKGRVRIGQIIWEPEAS